MKKAYLLAVLLIVVLALVGCGGGGGGGSDNDPAIPPNESTTTQISDTDKTDITAMLHTLASGIETNDIDKTSGCFNDPARIKFFWGEEDRYFTARNYFLPLFTDRPFRSYSFQTYPMTVSELNVIVDADVYFTEYATSAKSIYSENRYSVEIKVKKYDTGWKITSYMCTAPQY